MQNVHLDVVLDCRIYTWLLYRTADLSRGCDMGLQNCYVTVSMTAEFSRGWGNGLQNLYVDVVSHCKIFTRLWYETEDFSRGCGNGLQNGYVVWYGNAE